MHDSSLPLIRPTEVFGCYYSPGLSVADALAIEDALLAPPPPPPPPVVGRRLVGIVSCGLCGTVGAEGTILLPPGWRRVRRGFGGRRVECPACETDRRARRARRSRVSA